MNLSNCLRSIIVCVICCVGGLAISVGNGQEKAHVDENTVSEQDAVVDDNVKTLVQESQQLFEKEIKPLQEEFRAKMARIQAKLGLLSRLAE